MSTVAFIGTFDPAHGAHVGQLLRAHHHKPFTKAYILVDKHPAHKPHAAGWQRRLEMARLTFATLELPFDYEVLPVENSRATELQDVVDYKVTGADSLLENLSDPDRWTLARQWPMIVLSIPGAFEESDIESAIAELPKDIQKTVRYEYVSEADAPIMNYDFDRGVFIRRRIHSTYLRNGGENSFIPPSVREYIHKHGLYADRSPKEG